MTKENEKLLDRILIYLMIGVIFAFLNLNFINFGSALYYPEISTNHHYFSHHSTPSLENDITYVVGDVVAWPLVLFQNLLYFYTPYLVLITYIFLIFSIFNKFRVFEMVMGIEQ
jgi:hypothetical protein